MKKVFLGGTTNNSKWREELIPLLKINYCSPVLSKIDENSFQKEISNKKSSDYWLFVITPLIKEFNSIADVTQASNKYPDKTIFCYLPTDKEKIFSDFQIKSLNAIGKLIQDNGGKFFKSFYNLANFLNSQKD